MTEGVSPSLLDRWIKEGRLPHFDELRRGGVHGLMRSDFVPYEPPGLLSAFTGRRVGDHGVYSYWSVHEPEYHPRVVTSADLRQPFVWAREELCGQRVAVVNVFGTHPPMPVNGWLVTYPTVQTLHACHPQELLLALSRDGIRYAHDVSIWFSGQEREAFVGPVLRADVERGRAVLAALASGAELVVVNLTAIDRLSHVYWQELEPGSPVREEESAVFRAYATCDAILGNLLHLVDERTSLLTFSEIGFGPLRAYLPLLPRLAEAGLAPSADRGLVWEETRAFEAVQGTHGVNINLAGRQGRGTVGRGDYQHVVRDVVAALSDLRNPCTGLPMFRRVAEREAVYEGACVQNAPDVVLEPADERYLPLGDPQWANHVHRSLQSGWHRRDSCWSAVGGAFSQGASMRVAAPVDVAPTIFRMLDLDIPGDVAGTQLGGGP